MGSKNNIDFNCDLCQLVSQDDTLREFELLDYMSSVNISCCTKVISPISIKNALLKCKDKNIAVGAHISIPEEINIDSISNEDLETLIIYQLGAIVSFAKTLKMSVEHVRPHGKMYLKAANDFEFSLKIANAIKKFDKWITYVGFDNENLTKVSEQTGLIVSREVSVDKYYKLDGHIDWEKQDFVTPEISLNRLRTILYSSQMKVAGGNFLPVNCDSLHFSSMNLNSVELAKKMCEIIVPTPSNYNKVVPSGWV